MRDRVTAACIQVTAGREIGSNLERAADLIRRARDAGAELILTPENVAMLESRREPKFEKAEDEAKPLVMARFRALARETGAWLLAGSIAVRLPSGERLANRSCFFDPEGRLVARYDKIHMFDVDLPNGESYRESHDFRPGGEAVIAATPWGGLGLTTCYDLRFPQLYRSIAQAGARLIAIPSSFTVPTGRAHWHVLVRARAIETGAFVLAPAQTGSAHGGRGTYGHSLIVDPWGEVLADRGEEPGFVIAELDLARVEEVRAMLPSLRHDRSWRGPEPIAAPAEPATEY